MKADKARHVVKFYYFCTFANSTTYNVRDIRVYI